MARTSTSIDPDPDGDRRATPSDALLHIPGAGRHRTPRRRPAPRRPRATTVGGDDVVPAGRTLATVFLALVLGALLCADSVHRAAERQPFGPMRDAALAVTGPLRTVSHAVGLHLPREWLHDVAGTDDGPATAGAGAPLDEVPSAVDPAADPAAAPKPGADTAAAAAGGDQTGAGSSSSPSKVPAAVAPATTAPPTTAPPTTAPPTTVPAPRRMATAEAPVRIWMGGDSLLGNVAAGLGRLVDDDPRVVLDADFRVGTGLARPDVLDWPAHLAEQLAAQRPEVVYLLFGGNDDQDMTTPDGSRAVLGSLAWRDEYARRVGLAMDVAAADGRSVVWIGLPAHEPERLRVAGAVMAEVAREQAALRPAVTYVDTGTILTPGGTYTETVAGADGSTVDARAPDGVHLTHDGADLIAAALLAPVTTQFGLAAPG